MRQRFLDFPLFVVVLVFAFLASSFAVGNSDFWLHLASGRLLAEGRYQFGVDPFAFTTADHYWANHAWLFDGLLFLLYHYLGGAILVVGKALLVGVLAAVLLDVRRPDDWLGWPAACTLLALLALSPRLLLHSTCLSYVLLGLTLWLLGRPLEPSAPFRRQLRHYAPVLLLFVLWVNVDGWFLLGPLLAGLFWLGDAIAPETPTGETPVPPGERTRRTPGWVWLAGLAVCLVNPHHVHAFTLPVELMPLPAALRDDVRFALLHASPWRMRFYYHPLAGINWASGAYLVLLIGGALSFLPNVRSLSGWRLLVWLTFAGLSAWRARTIPFFAVVAAPILALNLQDAFRVRSASKHPSFPRLRYGLRWCAYLALVMSSLVLIALAWAGWLQGHQDHGRHVAWAVQPDGSLRRVAEKLQDWRRQGKLGDGRGFLSHPSLVHYCAWFCPEEKGFLDPRLALFGDAADDYEQICRAVNPGLAQGDRRLAGRGDWRSLLRNHGITHLVLYDTSFPRLTPALEQLADPTGDWTLLDIDGQALIVGWRDGERTLPERVPLFDGERLAFTAASASADEAMLAASPARGPERGPHPDDFWSHLGQASAPSPWETEAAGVLLSYSEAREGQRLTRRGFAWAAALAGLPALSAGSLDGPGRLAVHIEQASRNEPQSPALPLLAVRAARHALAQNPDDANAYLHLGRAYLHLAARTAESEVLGLLPPLLELRHIQIAVALENTLRRDADLLPAHDHLAALYEQRRFFDAALDHRRAALRLVRRAGPIPGEAATAFAQRLKRRQRDVKNWEGIVREQKNKFALQTQNLGSEPLRKAQIALDLGLARLALEEVLMRSSPVLLGGEGIRLQVRLHLMLGQMEVVRAQLQEPDWKKNKDNLGLVDLRDWSAPEEAPLYRLPAYEWFLLCQAAAFGDYEQADAALEALLKGLGGEGVVQEVRQLQQSLPRLVTWELGWSTNPHVRLRNWRTTAERLLQTEALNDLSADVVRQADLHVLGGMLSLERGRPRDAEKSFHETVVLDRLGFGTRHASAGRPLAEVYLRLLAKWPG